MRLVIFGLGYSGRAVALSAARAGAEVIAACRTMQDAPPCRVVPIDRILDALEAATHLLVTAPPDETGDPLIGRLGVGALGARTSLRWVGYLSTTGVYGDRGGAWVDETTLPAPTSERARRRLTAEAAWSRLADSRTVDLFRLAGIYGPGRSAFDQIRAGRARRIVKPGHAFGRIHRDDIAAAVCAAMRQERGPGVRVFNLADDEPAESAAVIAEAARLMGEPAPAEMEFDTAWNAMSPMARSFWVEDRKVSSAATKASLDIAWLYPTYREGLAAILREERGEDVAQ